MIRNGTTAEAAGLAVLAELARRDAASGGHRNVGGRIETVLGTFFGDVRMQEALTNVRTVLGTPADAILLSAAQFALPCWLKLTVVPLPTLNDCQFNTAWG